MSEPILNAVDMSRWGGELTADEAACLRERGIRLVIAGTGHPLGAGVFARQQATAWLAAGGELLDAYVYLSFAGDPSEQIRNALLTLDGLPVRRWWLDAEDVESPELRPAGRAAFLQRCLTALAGRPAGIYSGRWWWLPFMGNSTAFAALPLWDSHYPGGASAGHPRVAPWAERAYGGFAEPEIAQFHGTTVLCGQSVDLNWVQLEDEMTPDQVRAICEEFVAATFPAYLEAYFDGGFTARNGQGGTPPPRRFWQDDLDRAIAARDARAVPQPVPRPAPRGACQRCPDD